MLVDERLEVPLPVSEVLDLVEEDERLPVCDRQPGRLLPDREKVGEAEAVEEGVVHGDVEDPLRPDAPIEEHTDGVPDEDGLADSPRPHQEDRAPHRRVEREDRELIEVGAGRQPVVGRRNPVRRGPPPVVGRDPPKHLFARDLSHGLTLPPVTNRVNTLILARKPHAKRCGQT